MKSIAIFCGSSTGNDPAFRTSAEALGTLLVQEQISLVYGGAKVGLMGTIADSVIKAGGTAIGVLPKFLSKKEIAHESLTKLILCETMHERKQKIFELSDGFIALPGGFGTLEELCEMLTWQQLGLHPKPIGILNVNGFFNSLDQLFQAMELKNLLKKENRAIALFHDEPEALLNLMKNYRATSIPKWLDTHKT